MRNWVVVANASRARVLEETGTPGEYVHVADLVHPGSRLKGIDLADDRPGHMPGAPHGPGGAAYPPRTGVREHEHERFAAEVAEVLDRGLAQGQCAGLVLVASNPFLGLLHARLGDAARKAVLRTVPRDYTELRNHELARRVGPVRIAT
jgi:hypothetical protein